MNDTAPAFDNRAAYWRARFLELGGGQLDDLVARLLDDLPNLPHPIPRPLPLRIVGGSHGFMLTLLFDPDPLTARGASPADAVGALLAKAERVRTVGR